MPENYRGGGTLCHIATPFSFSLLLHNRTERRAILINRLCTNSLGIVAEDVISSGDHQTVYDVNLLV